MTQSKKEPKREMSLGPEMSPGVHAVACRTEDGIEFGSLSKMKNGVPIPPGTELVRLGSSTCGCGNWREVESLYKRPGEGLSTKNGPARVTTPSYRAGYDRIFGKTVVGES